MLMLHGLTPLDVGSPGVTQLHGGLPWASKPSIFFRLFFKYIRTSWRRAASASAPAATTITQ